MEKTAKGIEHELALALLDIRSVQNTASLFRTADCAGIKKIYLIGTTPTPKDRFGRNRGDFSKISLGAEKSVGYEYFSNTEEFFKEVSKKDFDLIALEQSSNSVDYKEVTLSKNTVLVLGNEVSGISEAVVKKCQLTVEIPMFGDKESLNVSVAGAIAIFRILNI